MSCIALAIEVVEFNGNKIWIWLSVPPIQRTFKPFPLAMPQI